MLVRANSLERVNGKENEAAVVLSVAFSTVDTVNARSERIVSLVAKHEG